MARETSPCALGRVGRLEATTRTCLSCHDGLAAPGVEYATTRGAGHGSHPVDVDYAQASMRPRARFRPQGALPASVVLPGGKVTCTSCHDGASREKHHTAMPMERSRLCTSCHDV
jgi:predicted CXXCH cytochrome family protein